MGQRSAGGLDSAFSTTLPVYNAQTSSQWLYIVQKCLHTTEYSLMPMDFRDVQIARCWSLESLDTEHCFVAKIKATTRQHE